MPRQDTTPFGNFGNFGNIMQQMTEEMNRMQRDMMEGQGEFANNGGGGNITTFSSTSYSSGGGNGHSVEYSSASRGAKGANGDMVTETQRKYRDSTGVEKSGTSRTLGDRGRNVVRQRMPTGEEYVRDNLRRINDNQVSEFEHEWERAAQSCNLPRGSQPKFLEESSSRALGGGARQGIEDFERQHRRMLEDARNLRSQMFGNFDRQMDLFEDSHRQSQGEDKQITVGLRKLAARRKQT
ncbi:hypothetical protein CYMTET_5396 [Cymbomonas tetramitiformis]|uniref:Myeloid leukemia factor n=1 Tax=Cymbomonas tetramitiformis TaxID=36881 RepID=A0AAE0H149_9CHLO|nr:hypothetical protein CYMTET_5396 [Cymbomonas tetramitiformis]